MNCVLCHSKLASGAFVIIIGGKKAAVLHIADGMASEVRQVLHIRSVLGW